MNKKLRIQRKTASGKTARRAKRTHSQETVGHRLLSQSNPSAAALEVSGQNLPLNQLP
jgi:hypothetical protein